MVVVGMDIVGGAVVLVLVLVLGPVDLGRGPAASFGTVVDIDAVVRDLRERCWHSAGSLRCVPRWVESRGPFRPSLSLLTCWRSG